MSEKDLVETAPTDHFEARFRRYTGLSGVLVKSLAVGLALFCLLEVGGVFTSMGHYFLGTQFGAIFLLVVSILIFLLFPAKKDAPMGHPAWYDYLLILASLVGNFYIIANALSLSQLTRIVATPYEIVLGLLTIVTLIECARRCTGWAIPVLSLLFLFYAKFAYLIPGPLGAIKISWGRLIVDVYISDAGIYGNLTQLTATVIIIFIIFGSFFIISGGGQFFLDLAFSLMGSVRGGPAKAAIIGSALFGSISGSAVSNVAVTGTITIPMMKKIGYSPEFAGAVESVASSGGGITPPVMAAIAFVMAAFLGVPYSQVVIIAIIPAILYYAALFIQTDLRAARIGLKGLSRSELPPLGPTLRNGWQFLIPFAALIVFLFIWRYPAAMSGVYTIIVFVIVSQTKKKTRVTPRRCVAALYNGTKSSLEVASMSGAAGVFLAVLTITGLGPRLSSGLVAMAGTSMLALVLTAAITCYIMGMGLPLLVSYILLSVLVAPALVNYGVPEIAAHFFIVFMTMSTFFTPPFCPVAFVAASIANAKPYAIAVQSVRLGIVAFVIPFVFIYDPKLLLIGTAGEIVLSFLTALVGVFALSVGIEGYLFKKCTLPQRILAVLSGLIMIIPGWQTDLLGAILLLFVFLRQRRPVFKN
ncbi:MAG: TRAP transporter fused permease subunit [Desulfobacterales bacterium]|nr:TRAP transporter fused permease subunit [Desulfobacterales bacterium]